MRVLSEQQLLNLLHDGHSIFRCKEYELVLCFLNTDVEFCYFKDDWENVKVQPNKRN